MPDGLSIDEFGLHVPEHMALSRKRNHGQGFLERNPAKLAVLVIDDDVRLLLHEAKEDRQQADRVAVGFIELLANIGRVELSAFQPGLFLDFAESGLPCFFTILDGSCNLAPLADQGVVPEKKQDPPADRQRGAGERQTLRNNVRGCQPSIASRFRWDVSARLMTERLFQNSS